VLVRGKGGEDDTGGAEDDRHRPRARDPDSERCRGLVARAGDLGRLVRGREPFEWDLERRADLLRPGAPADVEEEGARGIGDVDGELPGEAEPDIVLRQQHVPDAGVQLRLVPAQPQKLRRREAGQRAISGQLEEPREADPLLDLRTLGCGSLVVPQDRGA
jgi:hypothetical protein